MRAFGVLLFLALAGGLTAAVIPAADGEAPAVSGLEIGWAETEITPTGPVQLTGMGRAVRITADVRDPLTATALVLVSSCPDRPVRAALVSLELLSVSECIRDRVRARLAGDLPELPPEAVLFFATHTHTAPFHYTRPRYQPGFEQTDEPWIFRRPHHQTAGFREARAALEPMTCREYVDLVAERVTGALVEAWQNRAPGGVASGAGQASIGRNRVMRDQDIENETVKFLGTYGPDGTLRGLVVNLPSPVQAQAGGRRISADFMHETRRELRRHFGEDLFVLPQITAAGDIGPIRNRQLIAERLAAAAAAVLPEMAAGIDYRPLLLHHAEILPLPRLEPSTESPYLPVEVHALRLGGAGMVSNPFELFLDYGLTIRERSPAARTFVVQLAGPGSYLPTARAVEHGGYGATRGSRMVGPAGGVKLVEWSVAALEALWD